MQGPILFGLVLAAASLALALAAAVSRLRVLGCALSLSLLAGCASYPPVPEGVPERYLAFVERAEIPLPQRIDRYFGLRTTKGAAEGEDNAIVLYAPKTSPIRQVTIVFYESKENVYRGRIWAQFNPAVQCLAYKDISRIGSYKPGIPIQVHETGPNGFFGPVRRIETPDSFTLGTGGKVLGNAEIAMKDGCLALLSSPITSR